MGKTLRDVMVDFPRELLGSARAADHGGFPLLVKILDAAEDLSVQVHPDAGYASRHPGAHMKSEAWFILDATPGARILKGINPRITRGEFTTHVRQDASLPAASSRVPADLLGVPAVPGQCHWLPSGLCHALGAGTLVAEIQTPSDTTFRLYDWGRNDASRKLHLDEALECCLFGEAQSLAESASLCNPREIGAGVVARTLVAVPQFTSELLMFEARATGVFPPTGTPSSWLVLSGTGTANGLALLRGSSLIQPACCPEVVVRAQSSLQVMRTCIAAD